MPSNHTTTPVFRRRLGISGIVAAIIAVVAVGVGVSVRANNDRELVNWTNERAVPVVNVNVPDGSDRNAVLQLPGRFEAYAQAPIFARVGGYLKSWKVDIGAPVKAGQLLGEIETPDLDQQLLQAKADLASAQANQELAATTAKRWQAMLVSDSVSHQEVDDKLGDLAAKQAMLKASQANVDRIQALKGYTRLVAPFDGVVTARNTDTGALINANAGTGPALFVVSNIRKLRLYVNVPQNYVQHIKPGTKAEITVPEHPGKTYTATVESSAQSVDRNSGTMLMQLAVDNASGELVSGGYASVNLALPDNVSALNIPASALMFDQSGLHVATVDKDSKVVLKEVTIARDLGKVIELGAGLQADDRVIESPPDGISTGDAVRVAEAKPAEAAVPADAAKGSK